MEDLKKKIEQQTGAIVFLPDLRDANVEDLRMFLNVLNTNIMSLIQAHIREVLKDEDEKYTSDLKATWHDQMVADGTIARRNQLRKELRKAFGLEGEEQPIED